MTHTCQPGRQGRQQFDFPLFAGLPFKWLHAHSLSERDARGARSAECGCARAAHAAQTRLGCRRSRARPQLCVRSARSNLPASRRRSGTTAASRRGTCDRPSSACECLREREGAFHRTTSHSCAHACTMCGVRTAMSILQQVLGASAVAFGPRCPSFRSSAVAPRKPVRWR